MYDDLREQLSALPHHEPFTAAQARARGVTPGMLRRGVLARLLVHPVRGVYHRTGLEDTLELRVACLRLVVPPECVITDRTAAWLLGAEHVLAPGDHLETPRVSVFSPPGHRLRNGLAASGERMLTEDDVVEIGGLRVTTALRTACDLGRLLHRDQALAALDSLSRLGSFQPHELLTAPDRFKGYRGVVQLRFLVPLVDPMAQSPGESILRLRWIDCGLPVPECQIELSGPGGRSIYLDLGLRSERFAAEYDGAAFHGEDQRVHDEARREWARSVHGWTIVVARAHNIHGPHQDIDRMLHEGRRQALKWH